MGLAMLWVPEAAADVTGPGTGTAEHGVSVEESRSLGRRGVFVHARYWLSRRWAIGSEAGGFWSTSVAEGARPQAVTTSDPPPAARASTSTT
jgi:hypothetical protein